jgi:hypothetical protein
LKAVEEQIMVGDEIEKLKAAMASAAIGHLREEAERLKAEIESRKGDRPESELTETEVAAKALARLSLLNVLDYEKARVPAARKLRCRPSVLDRLVRDIRAQLLPANVVPAKAPRANGEEISFCDGGGRVVTAFVVISVHSGGRDRDLVIRADGTGRAVWSIRFTDEEHEEWRRRTLSIGRR